MPVLPIINSFRRRAVNCACPGWEKISLLPVTSVNWASVNAAIATYYNAALGTITSTALPVNVGTNYILFDAFKDTIEVDIKAVSDNKTEVTISGEFEFDCVYAMQIDRLRSQCSFIANLENCNGSQTVVGLEPNNLLAPTELVHSNISYGRLKFTKFDWKSGTMGGGITSAKGVFEMKGVFQYYPKCTTGFQTLTYLP